MLNNFSSSSSVRNVSVSKKRASSSGQTGLTMAIAVLVFGFLLIVGPGISSLQQSSATYSIANKNQLKAYYYAQAGIQEAMGTRFVPTTNCLNFQSPATSYRYISGRYDANGNLAYRNDVAYGLYRYMIDIINPNLPENIAYNQPNTPVTLRVYSEGAICVDQADGKLTTINSIGDRPFCAKNTDKLIQTPIFVDVVMKQLSGNSVNVPQPNNISGFQAMTKADFETKWHNQCVAATNNLTVKKYMLNNGTPQNFTVGSTINMTSSDTITFIFNKPIDYRSLKNVVINQGGTLTNLNNSSNLLIAPNTNFMETSTSFTILPSTTPGQLNGDYQLYLDRLRSYDDTSYPGTGIVANLRFP